MSIQNTLVKDVIEDITFTVIGSGENGQGRRKGLSTRELLFETQKILIPGMLLELLVHAEDNGIPPLETMVEVLRVEQKNQYGYEVSGGIKDIR